MAGDGFYYGLLEGFYGRPWQWAERHAMVDFLAAHDFSCYIYAPKADRALRRDWAQPFSDDWIEQVTAWGQRCRDSGVRWGLGLSPFGLQAGYGPAESRRLLAKLEEIRALAPDHLWILFDDMRGDTPQLAANQCAVVNDVRAVYDGHIAICPSYYSFDPLLDELFGVRPADYLQDLGRGLPGNVDVLWTGESVLSANYSQQDCERVAEAIRRKPLIWDNYPVNDGRKTSNFLHLDAFRGRSADMARWCAGHMSNPMNQAWLSRLPLATLQALYADKADYNPDDARNASFLQLPIALRELLARDWRIFQGGGLNSLDAARLGTLKDEYACIQHPAASEICQWLNGEYEFDPECLND